jgi:hypothetical protein
MHHRNKLCTLFYLSLLLTWVITILQRLQGRTEGFESRVQPPWLIVLYGLPGVPESQGGTTADQTIPHVVLSGGTVG